jgi:predicted nucleic acid-binding Zn ribbon protein
VDGGQPSAPKARRRVLPLIILVLLIVALIVLAAWGLSR